eukprot:11028612-Lingulodinium_polyedra.AAC.1
MPPPAPPMSDPPISAVAAVKEEVWRRGPAGACKKIPELTADTVTAGSPAPVPSPTVTVSAVERVWRATGAAATTVTASAVGQSSAAAAGPASSAGAVATSTLQDPGLAWAQTVVPGNPSS